MNKDFEEYKRKRCNEALVENASYMKKEQDLNFPREYLQEEAEELCYSKGFFDGIRFVLKNMKV